LLNKEYHKSVTRNVSSVIGYVGPGNMKEEELREAVGL